MPTSRPEASKAEVREAEVPLPNSESVRAPRERVEELPPETPKETTAADLLALRTVRAGVSNTFWPGGDSAPRGSTEASPRENAEASTLSRPK